MLDALCISGCLEGRHPDRTQEREDRCVTRPCRARDPCASRGERDWTVPILAREPLGDESSDDSNNRDMRDSHKSRQVTHAACSGVCTDVVHCLGVVLKGLRRVISSRFCEPFAGRRGWHYPNSSVAASERNAYDVAMATFARRCRWLLVLAGVAAQCAMQAPPDAGAQRLNIVATTGMIGDMCKRIVGDLADVKTLMGEGVDPHLYKATVSDVRALAGCDAVVANGLMLEGRMGEVFARIRARGRLVIDAGASLHEAQRLSAEGAGAHPDPHIWMDPAIWAQCARHVAKKLAASDPVNGSAYMANAETLVTEWTAADAAIQRAIATIRPAHRVLVTAHDAFAYFGRHYGVEVLAIQGISTESESGLADIRRLVDVLVSRDVPAVFVESSVSQKNVLALVEGARARGHEVVIGGSLYSDAMGAAGTSEGTYTGMITKNAQTIVQALGGNASSLTTEKSQ